MSKIVDFPARQQEILRVLRGRFPKGQFVTAVEIAAFMHCSTGSIRQPALQLIRRRRLDGRKGPGGGYRLAR